VVASLVTPLLRAQAGGAQAFLCDLARGLAARHDVLLYCAAGSEVPGVELVPIEVSPAVRTALVRPGSEPAGPVPELRDGFERLFAELRRRGADAVSSHAFDADAFELSEGLPALHTLHLPPVVPAVVAAARSTRARLVTVSESSRRDWRRAGVEAAVIRNGVPDFDPGTPPVEEVALIPGRISPEKGTAAAIEIARRAGLRPLVVGDPYDRRYFASEVEPRLRPGECRPAVPRAELARMMAAARVVLMPIDWDEPFGLVAAEAQVAGCPVAGYRRGALPEVVEEGVGGFLVEPGDAAGLASAARRCASLDRAGIRRRALACLLLDRSIEEYEAALAEVAG
jgi:glycosyltransferase involved in cell wall biosynthesis